MCVCVYIREYCIYLWESLATHGPKHLSCGYECGPWCLYHCGAPGKLSEPISLTCCEGPGLGHRSCMGTHQRQPEPGANGRNNLMRVLEGSCWLMGSGKGASLFPGQLPGSTAKHVGSAHVVGRGKAVRGAWSCFPTPCAMRELYLNTRDSPLLSGYQSSPQVSQGTLAEPGH